MDAKLRKYCQKRKAALLAKRTPHEPDWQQVADYIDPYAGQHLRARDTTGAPRKLPSRAKIINSAAVKALRTMDAGFMGGHTSKSRAWFRLGVSDPKLQDSEEVKVWLDDLTQSIRDVLARSNFYTALPGLYHARHLFGVGAMAVDEDDEDVVRFYNRPIGTYAIGLDRRGRCDTFWYSFRWTVHQIMQAFEPVVGREGLPQRVQECIKGDRLDEEFTIDCLIEPNPDAKPGAQGPMKRKVRQVYWIEGNDTDQHGCLDYQGHYEMKVLAPRWGAEGNDIYGPSPSLDALGDIKQLQYLEGQKLWIIDMMAKPALALPTSLRNKGSSLAPGSKMYVTPEETAQVKPIYEPNPRGLSEVKADIAVVEARVREAFFADLFRMLDYLEDRTRTAYEISERKEEKVAMLGPALETLTDELLDPVIEIVYSMMERQGRLKPAPMQLDHVPLKVEYTSILAQSQKAAETGSVERVLGIVAMAAKESQDPSWWDKIDADATVEIIHDQQGAAARMIRTDDAVAQRRQGRAQAQQMETVAAIAPALKQGAEAMKVAGETVPQAGSVGAGMSEAVPA